MDAVIPWARLVALVEPHYSRGGSGRKPMPLERMLRIHFLQQWYAYSHPGMSWDGRSPLRDPAAAAIRGCRLGAVRSGTGCRHGGVDAKAAGLIAAGGHDASAGRIAADDDRLTSQLGIVPLLLRGKKASMSMWMIWWSSAPCSEYGSGNG